ncbi:MAG: EVE domain-containing protein, partial [Novosphingobium sp.]
DPSDDTGTWTSVKLKPVKKLKRPVSLKEIKTDPALAEMELLTKFRLSVSKVSAGEWANILHLAEMAESP